MGTLRLHAMSVGELRDLFSGSPDAAAHLRTAAIAAFPPERKPVGLLSKLGPLFRHAPDAPIVRPGVPTETDIQTLVAGHFIAPDRVTAAWALVEAYLDDAGWSTMTLTLDDHEVDALEFDLARAGMPSAYGLRKLFTEPLGIPLQNAPGQSAGFVRNERLAAWASGWGEAAEAVSQEHRETAERMATWLAGFAEWTTAAVAAGRLAPDAIATHTAG
jgi:hypothetical protein